MVLLFALAAMLIGGAAGLALVLALRGAFRSVPFPDAAVLRSIVREEVGTLWLTHRHRLTLLVILCGTAGAVLGSAVVPARTVTAFVYTYPFGAGAGLRAWTLDRLGRWHERDSGGHDARLFDVTARDVANGCPGSSTHESAQPRFEFFIPDAGCRPMALMMRRDGGPWSPLGPMSITSTGAARAD